MRLSTLRVTALTLRARLRARGRQHGRVGAGGEVRVGVGGEGWGWGSPGPGLRLGLGFGLAHLRMATSSIEVKLDDVKLERLGLDWDLLPSLMVPSWLGGVGPCPPHFSAASLATSLATLVEPGAPLVRSPEEGGEERGSGEKEERRDEDVWDAVVRGEEGVGAVRRTVGLVRGRGRGRGRGGGILRSPELQPAAAAGPVRAADDEAAPFTWTREGGVRARARARGEAAGRGGGGVRASRQGVRAKVRVRGESWASVRAGLRWRPGWFGVRGLLGVAPEQQGRAPAMSHWTSLATCRVALCSAPNGRWSRINYSRWTTRSAGIWAPTACPRRT